MGGAGCKWIEECRGSGDHDEEEVKSLYVHVAVMDPGCSLSRLELSLVIGQQGANGSMNCAVRRAQAPFSQWSLTPLSVTLLATPLPFYFLHYHHSHHRHHGFVFLFTTF